VFSVPELAVVRFTDQVLADGKVEAEIFQQVYELLDARRVVELLLAIGLYQMLGQVMTAVEIDLDEAAGREVIESSLPRPGTDAGRRRAG
jgi:alkylhydroperoxidase family enzyme